MTLKQILTFFSGYQSVVMNDEGSSASHGCIGIQAEAIFWQVRLSFGIEL